MPKRPKSKYHSKWDDRFYVMSYELARQGRTNGEIAKTVGVVNETFMNWTKSNPVLREGLERARGGNLEATTNFKNYIHGQLPPHLQELWEDLMECDSEKSGIARVNQILYGQKHNRQQLFLHGLIAFNFNVSRALKVVGITRGTVKKWEASDPKFHELLNEMDWHKGNFFENALLQGVARGESNLVKFVNETFNKDRGYGRHVDVEVMGDVSHSHAVINIDTLGISLELKKQLLEAIRNPESAKDDVIVEGKLLPPSNQNGSNGYKGNGKPH